VIWLGAILPLSASGHDHHPGQKHSITLLVCGFERHYSVVIPRCYDGSRALPVVVALHGSGGNASAFLDEANWVEAADKFGIIVIAPEGLPLMTGLPSTGVANPRVWNSGQYSSKYPRTRIDDVAFIVAVLDDAARRWLLDPRRTYAAGFSNGGAMAFRLAAERADRFTAIASVSGLNWIENPHPCRALPTLMIHGHLDPLVPMHGGVKVLPWEISTSPPVHAVLAKWAVATGCPPNYQDAGEVPGHHVRIEDYGPAPGGNVVRLMNVKFQGHAWPGGNGIRPERMLGPDLSHFDATGAICAFFSQWSY
jgi:polyhydroxybutyrate depolymerase